MNFTNDDVQIALLTNTHLWRRILSGIGTIGIDRKTKDFELAFFLHPILDGSDQSSNSTLESGMNPILLSTDWVSLHLRLHMQATRALNPRQPSLSHCRRINLTSPLEKRKERTSNPASDSTSSCIPIVYAWSGNRRSALSSDNLR
jgi:hypothetical protein